MNLNSPNLIRHRGSAGLWSWAFLWAIVTLVGGVSGCRSVEPPTAPPESNFTGPLSEWSNHVRDGQADGTSFGLSEKSRQIERNLGVR